MAGNRASGSPKPFCSPFRGSGGASAASAHIDSMDKSQYSLSLSTVLGDTMGRRRSSYSYREAYRPSIDIGLFRPLMVSPRVRALTLGSLTAALEETRRRRLSVLDAAVLGSEDRRFFHPLGSRAPAGGLSRGARALVVPASSVTASGPIPVGIGFKDATQVATCVRRRVRREVIMAKGRGGGGHRPPRKGYWSDVWC